MVLEKVLASIVILLASASVIAVPCAAEPPENPSAERRLQREEDERQKRDEENRRRAEADIQAELAVDQQVRNAGGLVLVKRSPEYWSGEGKDFSEWYYLPSDPTPQGYRISEVVFRLVGDRNCGAWSECVEAERASDHVTWRFRMQGHDENLSLEMRSVFVKFAKAEGGGWSISPNIDFRVAGRKATSVGILKVRYLPIR